MSANNNVHLIGRLTSDPELRYTSNGKACANFRLAVDNYGDKEADFFRIVAWNKTAETCVKSITKGRLVAVHGRLSARSYDGNDGQKKYITEVVADDVKFLDWPKDKQANLGDMASNEPVNDDDLPF